MHIGEPNYLGLSTKEYDWEHTLYGGKEENVSTDVPPHKGKFVTLTHLVDANLVH